MESNETIQLLLHGNQLKQTARTGWGQRGVRGAENVAAHTFGVAWAVLVLAEVVGRPFNLERALSMALLHDLPEGLTTDIPSPAWHYLPDGIKSDVERGAMGEILAGASTSFAGQMMDLWEELHAAQSEEALLVHDADKIDLYLQALVYGQQTGNRMLAEFWETPARLHFPEVQAIYDQLRQRWQKSG